MKKFVFKSKYRDDKVSLTKPIITPNPDGSRTVEGGKMAEFSHNTFVTYESDIASLLRDAIEKRKAAGLPLQVFETTEDEPVKIEPAVRKGVKGSTVGAEA